MGLGGVRYVVLFLETFRIFFSLRRNILLEREGEVVRVPGGEGRVKTGEGRGVRVPGRG